MAAADGRAAEVRRLEGKHLSTFGQCRLDLGERRAAACSHVRVRSARSRRCRDGRVSIEHLAFATDSP
jgi:hypothetical protein